MRPEDVKTVADAKKIVNERKLTHVKVGVFDIDGILRGKYMAREKFFSSLDKGFGFCDVVLGWDSNDQLYDNTQFTGWHTGYPDAEVRILPQTCRDIPFEPGMLFFLAEFSEDAKARRGGATDAVDAFSINTEPFRRRREHAVSTVRFRLNTNPGNGAT